MRGRAVISRLNHRVVGWLEIITPVLSTHPPAFSALTHTFGINLLREAAGAQTGPRTHAFPHGDEDLLSLFTVHHLLSPLHAAQTSASANLGGLMSSTEERHHGERANDDALKAQT